MNTTKHVTLVFKGNAHCIVQMCDLLRYLDVDWPYGEGLSRTGVRKVVVVCPTCQGIVYSNPVFEQKEIMAAGRQCGVKVKFKRWEDGRKCEISCLESTS